MVIGNAVTVMVSSAVAWDPPVAAEVAVSVSTIEAGEGSAAGGVYTVEVLGPVELSVPQGPPLQPVPERAQVTLGVEAYVDACAVTEMVALPAWTGCTDAGLTVTAIGGFTVRVRAGEVVVLSALA